MTATDLAVSHRGIQAPVYRGQGQYFAQWRTQGLAGVEFEPTPGVRDRINGELFAQVTARTLPELCEAWRGVIEALATAYPVAFSVASRCPGLTWVDPAPVPVAGCKMVLAFVE